MNQNKISERKTKPPAPMNRRLNYCPVNRRT